MLNRQRLRWVFYSNHLQRVRIAFCRLHLDPGAFQTSGLVDQKLHSRRRSVPEDGDCDTYRCFFYVKLTGHSTALILLRGAYVTTWYTPCPRSYTLREAHAHG